MDVKSERKIGAESMSKLRRLTGNFTSQTKKPSHHQAYPVWDLPPEIILGDRLRIKKKGLPLVMRL